MPEAAPRWTCACGRRCAMDQARCPNCGGARTTAVTTAAVVVKAVSEASAPAAPPAAKSIGRPSSGRVPVATAPIARPASSPPKPAPPAEDAAAADVSAYASDDPPAAAAQPPPVASEAPARPRTEAPSIKSASGRYSRMEGLSAAPSSAPEPPRPRPQTFGPPPAATSAPVSGGYGAPVSGGYVAPASAVEEIGQLFDCFMMVMGRGGPLAAGIAIVTAPVACVLAGVAVFVALHLGLIGGIVGTFAAVSLAIAVTIAGPLATFLIASSNETPKADVVLKLAVSRAPALAWFFIVMFFVQVAISIPFYCVAGSNGPLLGSIAAFFLWARVATIGIPYTVAFNSPFGETLSKAMDLGRGRFPLLCVAAGIPRLILTLIGQFGLPWVVTIDPENGPSFSLGKALAVAVAVIATFLADMAFSASALNVVSRPAGASGGGGGNAPPRPGVPTPASPAFEPSGFDPGRQPALVTEKSAAEKLSRIPAVVWLLPAAIGLGIGFQAVSTSMKFMGFESKMCVESIKLEVTSNDVRGKTIDMLKKAGYDVKPDDIQMILFQDIKKDARVFAVVTVRHPDVNLQIHQVIKMKEGALEHALDSGFELVREDYSKVWPEPGGSRPLRMLVGFAIALTFILMTFKMWGR